MANAMRMLESAANFFSAHEDPFGSLSAVEARGNYAREEVSCWRASARTRNLAWMARCGEIESLKKYERYQVVMLNSSCARLSTYAIVGLWNSGRYQSRNSSPPFGCCSLAGLRACVSYSLLPGGAL
jgi:hypothetical protein